MSPPYFFPSNVNAYIAKQPGGLMTLISITAISRKFNIFTTTISHAINPHTEYLVNSPIEKKIFTQIKKHNQVKNI